MSFASRSGQSVWTGASLIALGIGLCMAGTAAASTVLQGKAVATTIFDGTINLKKMAESSASAPASSAQAPTRRAELFRSVPLRMPPRRGAKDAAIQSFLAPAMPKETLFSSNISMFGFTGITHYQQRTADGGNQFSVEPPDQALAVNDRFVLESVNDAIAVYDTAGNTIAAPIALSQFFNQPDEINRTTGELGPFLSDPRAYFDPDSQRWFVVVWATLNDASGNPLDVSVQFIAVSATDNPAGTYYLYHIETTNSQIPGCPCFPDFQQIGFDKNGMYITQNFFSLVLSGEPYVGANIYAISKAGLVSGTGGTVIQFPLLANDFTVHPTVAPPRGGYAIAQNGTEYLVEGIADLTSNGVSASLRIFAISGTNSLATKTPNLKLGRVDVATQTYAEPIPAVQPDGPRPLAESLTKNGREPPVPLLDGGSARVGAQPVYVGGDVVLAIGTGLPATTKPVKDGVVWFDVHVAGGASNVAAKVRSQGVVAAPQQTNLLYPAIAMPTSGVGGIGVTLVGPGNYPSTAVIPLTLFGTSGGTTGRIQMAGIGALPDDGFTAYKAFGGNGVGRWGDYGAAGVDSRGSLWFSNEFIPDTSVYPRTTLANWGTFLTRFQSSAPVAAAVGAPVSGR